MVEKQQRAFLKQTGAEKPLMEIMREAAAKNFAPLFRGTIPLMVGPSENEREGGGGLSPFAPPPPRYPPCSWVAPTRAPCHTPGWCSPDQRGASPLMPCAFLPLYRQGHSLASATLGLVGQPRLQK